MNTAHQKTILLAGGTGLIGTRLLNHLESKNYRVFLLSRNPNPDKEYMFKWDPEKGEIDEECIRHADVIINLAGEGIADKRWTSRRKRKIINSRIFSTNILINSVNKLPNNVKLFVNASAIGFYGNTGEMIMHEESNAGTDFLSQVCNRWEQAAMMPLPEQTRRVIFRIGLVLASEGGMLQEIRKALQFRIAPIFGNGGQYQSWIHIDDLCRMITKAIRDEQVSGTYNAVAPGPLSNNNLTKLITQISGGGYLVFKIPLFILKILLGEMSSVITSGTRASSKKIESTGFIFTFPQANLALRNLLGK